jgi:hypothetical protein
MAANNASHGIAPDRKPEYLLLNWNAQSTPQPIDGMMSAAHTIAASMAVSS